MHAHFCTKRVTQNNGDVRTDEGQSVISEFNTQESASKRYTLDSWCVGNQCGHSDCADIHEEFNLLFDELGKYRRVTVSKYPTIQKIYLQHYKYRLEDIKDLSFTPPEEEEEKVSDVESTIVDPVNKPDKVTHDLLAGNENNNSPELKPNTLNNVPKDSESVTVTSLNENQGSQVFPVTGNHDSTTKKVIIRENSNKGDLHSFHYSEKCKNKNIGSIDREKQGKISPRQHVEEEKNSQSIEVCSTEQDKDSRINNLLIKIKHDSMLDTANTASTGIIESSNEDSIDEVDDSRTKEMSNDNDEGGTIMSNDVSQDINSDHDSESKSLTTQQDDNKGFFISLNGRILERDEIKKGRNACIAISMGSGVLCAASIAGFITSCVYVFSAMTIVGSAAHGAAIAGCVISAIVGSIAFIVTGICVKVASYFQKALECCTEVNEIKIDENAIENTLQDSSSIHSEEIELQ